MHKKSLCLINIGDELLNGRTLNTNARDISDIALKHGISTDYHITIGDDRDIIIDTLKSKPLLLEALKKIWINLICKRNLKSIILVC